MKRNYTVYLHTTPNGKHYVGITGMSVNRRWNNGRGYIKCPLFYNAIKKYGWSNIEHKIIATGLTKEEAELKEIELISFYRANQREYGYNISNGGTGVNSYSKEMIEKMKANNAKAKKVVCNGMEFNSARECSDYFNVNYSTMMGWLNGQINMPREWYNKGLRYECKTMEEYTPRKVRKYTPKKKIRKIHCDGKIFNNIKECSDYYNVNYHTMKNWLRGLCAMKQEFVDMGLNYID